jgi:radical SAM protein with 4Fe4S-binding SPASM domain
MSMVDCTPTPELDRISERALRRNVPLQALFELTGRCNLDCGHCYLDIANPPSELTTEQAKAVIDQLADAGTLFLTLSGGELFLRKDAIEVARHARQRGLAVRLFTNGTRIDRKLAAEIAAVHPLSVEISIYGVHGDAHDSVTRRRRSLRRSLKGALLLKRAGVAVGLKAPMVGLVATDLDEIYRLGDRMGMPMAFDPFITPRLDGSDAPAALRASTSELADALRHPRLGWTSAASTLPAPASPDEAPCAIARRACKIDPSGNLYPCSTYPIPVGNVLEHSLAELWAGGELIDRLRSITVRDLQGECTSCSQSGYCTRCMAVSSSMATSSARLARLAASPMPRRWRSGCAMRRARARRLRRVRDRPARSCSCVSEALVASSETTLDPASIPTKSTSAAWQRIDGETVLLNVDGHELLGLNAVAGRVWDLIDGRRTIDQLVESLAGEFPKVPPAQLRTDIDAFLRDLVVERMITLRLHP